MLSKRKVSGGVLAVVGYMLSPLSWWNDAVVNLPLALLFAWMVSAFWEQAFTGSLVFGYWLTNVAGLVMMQKGAFQMFGSAEQKYSLRKFAKDIGISLLYTLLILLLVKWGVLQPFQNYGSSSGQGAP